MDTTLDNWLALFDGQTRYRPEINDNVLKPDVLNFRGRETLNAPFEWRIEFTTPQKGISRQDAMLKYATLSMLSGRVVQGIITGFEHLQETMDQAHFAEYETAGTYTRKARRLDTEGGAAQSIEMPFLFPPIENKICIPCLIKAIQANDAIVQGA